MELTPDRQQRADEWTERIRNIVAGAIGRPALWAAEQLGKRISFDNDYPDEEYDD